MTLDLLSQFQSHINELAALKRNHYFPGRGGKEDDISHSFTVAILAWQLNESSDANLRTDRLLQYALLHDFVEVYAGDVNTFASPQARAQKEIDEQASLERLKTEYRDAPSFVTTLEAYQAQQDEEARFVWGCDKMQALIQGRLDAWRCYYELSITNEQFRAKIDEQYQRMHPALREEYDKLAAACVASYHYTAPLSVARK